MDNAMTSKAYREEWLQLFEFFVGPRYECERVISYEPTNYWPIRELLQLHNGDLLAFLNYNSYPFRVINSTELSKKPVNTNKKEKTFLQKGKC